MTTEGEVVSTLRRIPGYQKAFREAFSGAAESVTFDNMARALGAFERGLVTLSRWDRFMGGDRNAITDEEMSGHQQFMQAGCMSCHNGRCIGGQTFQKPGAIRPGPTAKISGEWQSPATRRTA
jgi:cytochrome c peroxidase